jgi:hypothetical protein
VSYDNDPAAQAPPQYGAPPPQYGAPAPQYGPPVRYAPAPQYGQAPVAPVYAQPVGYVAPVYAYAPPPRGLSITSMVLGLGSILFGWTFLVPIGAVIFGIIGLRREPAGKGFALTGLIAGGVILLGWILLVVFYVLLLIGIFGTAVAGAGAYSYS